MGKSKELTKPFSITQPFNVYTMLNGHKHKGNYMKEVQPKMLAEFKKIEEKQGAEYKKYKLFVEEINLMAKKLFNKHKQAGMTAAQHKDAVKEEFRKKHNVPSKSSAKPKKESAKPKKESAKPKETGKKKASKKKKDDDDSSSSDNLLDDDDDDKVVVFDDDGNDDLFSVKATKKSSKKAAPKKTPKKDTPKKATPKKDAPKKITPKKDAPKKDGPPSKKAQAELKKTHKYLSEAIHHFEKYAQSEGVDL